MRNNRPQYVYLTTVGDKLARHDSYKHFRVQIEDQSHSHAEGINDFEVADERHELEGDLLDASVLGSVEHKSLFYVKFFRCGREHYDALGHDARSLAHPSCRRLVLLAVAWVAEAD